MDKKNFNKRDFIFCLATTKGSGVNWSAIPKELVQWELDPLDKFPDTDAGGILSSLGLIPQFLDKEADDVIETAIARYGMSLGGPMEGGTVSAEGVYSYPGDPDLYPLAKCIVKDKTVYVYNYGMISFTDNETSESETYRFD